MIRLARHALAHPRAWLAVFAVATLLVGAGAARLELRTDGDVLRPHGDPVVAVTADDAIRFRDPRQAVLLVRERPQGPALTSPEGLRFLAHVQRTLRETWSVRAETLRSLASLPRLSRGDGSLAVGP